MEETGRWILSIILYIWHKLTGKEPPPKGVLDYKMYCIFSEAAVKAAKGNRGKMHAQSGHAFLHAYWDAEKRFPKTAKAYRDITKGGAGKITLIAPETVVNMLYEDYVNEGGITRVVDRGLTVFDGETLTAVGIGPLHLKGERLAANKPYYDQIKMFI